MDLEMLLSFMPTIIFFAIAISITYIAISKQKKKDREAKLLQEKQLDEKQKGIRQEGNEKIQIVSPFEDNTIVVSHKHDECKRERSISFHKHSDCVEERNNHEHKNINEVEFEEDYKISFSQDEIKNAIIWGEVLNNPAFKKHKR